MTRMLSELLNAKEPDFRLNVRQLEKASGEPSADIRLGTLVAQRTQTKIRELGLNPSDTTCEELYGALRSRLIDDDRRLRISLGLDHTENSADILSATQGLVESLDIPSECFAIKHSVVKRLFKDMPPKQSMKALGYRSLDSMLKHEPVAQLYVAARMYESTRWQQNFIRQYTLLEPNAFETRAIELLCPKSARWRALANDFARDYRHTSSVVRELGSVVSLPVSEKIPVLAITSALILIDGYNEIRYSSAFLKLQQVKPEFGRLVAQVASGKPFAVAQLAGQVLPWQTMHYYYSLGQDTDIPLSFEPHVQREDLRLAKAEQALAEKMPALDFWRDTDQLAFVRDGQTVSLNIFDVAISAANDLPFVDRLLHYVRDRVWQALLVSYLNPSNLEQVLRQLGNELAEPKPELAEVLETVEA